MMKKAVMSLVVLPLFIVLGTGYSIVAADEEFNPPADICLDTCESQSPPQPEYAPPKQECPKNECEEPQPEPPVERPPKPEKPVEQPPVERPPQPENPVPSPPVSDKKLNVENQNINNNTVYISGAAVTPGGAVQPTSPAPSTPPSTEQQPPATTSVATPPAPAPPATELASLPVTGNVGMTVGLASLGATVIGCILYQLLLRRRSAALLARRQVAERRSRFRGLQ